MKESEIRPEELFSEYLRLSAEDAKKYFSDKNTGRQYRDCPACGRDNAELEFEKLGFNYVRCDFCHSLYANPCPEEELLAEYYRDSESSKYWAEVFFPTVSGIRREKIFRERANKINELFHTAKIELNKIIDVGAGFGIFLEEIQKQFPKAIIAAVEPSTVLARECKNKGFPTMEGFAHDAANKSEWKESADLVTSFEVIEHIINPLQFINDMKSLIKTGGTLLITGLFGDGFDIQILGLHSKSISPPHHINFLSRRGVDLLMERADLKLVNFITPGKLDVDIVRNALSENKELVKDPFLLDLLLNADEKTQDNFQKFLSENCLSSHMWILARS